jgi:hypothetical protein
MKSLRHIGNLRGAWNQPSTSYLMSSICGNGFVAADDKEQTPQSDSLDMV